MGRTVVILDDEQLILQTLRTALPWRQLGFTVAGSAENGQEGRALIDAVQPDLVLTDIVMPGLTGLELVEYCAQKHPGTRFILLSAHSEFAYAQKAMSYGVTHYVLKPIDTEKLVAAVRAVARELDGRDARAQKEDRLRALAEDSRTLKSAASASLLFSIARYGREITPQEKSLLLQTDAFCTSVLAAVRLFNTSPGAESPLGAAQRQYQAQLAAAGFRLTWGSLDEGLIFLCPLPPEVDPQLARRRLCAQLARVGEGLPAELGIAAAAVSGIYRDLEGLHHCYGQCLRLLEQGFFCDAPAVLEPAAPPPPEAPFDTGLLLHHLRHGNEAALAQELGRWRAWLVRQHDAPRAAYALRELHRAATQEASRAGMAEKPVPQRRFAAENFTALFAALQEYLAGICAYVAQSQSMAGRLQLLLEEQYGDAQLNLTALADAVGVNSSYLSRLFKKEFGENFSDYLLRVRIGHACFLLRSTHLKNAEIAARVGFEDDHYFGQVFKKKMGCTPGQYREKEAAAGPHGAKSYPPG